MSQNTDEWGLTENEAARGKLWLEDGRRAGVEAVSIMFRLDKQIRTLRARNRELEYGIMHLINLWEACQDPGRSDEVREWAEKAKSFLTRAALEES